MVVAFLAMDFSNEEIAISTEEGISNKKDGVWNVLHEERGNWGLDHFCVYQERTVLVLIS